MSDAILALEPADKVVSLISEDHGPTVAYCVTYADAEALIAEMLRDAAGRPLALDLETAPTEAAAEQLKALVEQRAALMTEIKAAKKARAPSDAIEALKAEAALLATRIKYAMSAGFDPHRSRIRLAQLHGGGDRVAVIDVFQAGKLTLNLFKRLDVVAHHAAFELICLEAAGVDLGEVHCTMQAARLTCGERAMGLSDAVKAHLGTTLDKDLQASDWSKPQLDQAQLTYAAKDVVALWRLSEAIFPALGPQTPAYEIQIACTPAVARMRHRGILLDLEAHAGLMRSLKAKRVETCETYIRACEDMGLPELAAKVASTPAEKRIALQALLAGPELKRWKRTEKSRMLSTARSDLQRAAAHPPIQALVTMSKIDKMLSAFGQTLVELVSPVTGRIHADYRVAATASGRATCSHPNLQQAPRDKEFRALLKASTGCKFVGADFSSMELRAAAHISGDRAMTEAFAQGLDLHKITAARISGKKPEEVTKEERQAAKPVNFGAVYGIGVNGLVATAWDEYGVVLSLAEASAWLDAFAKSYPDFIRWRSRHAAKCEREGRIVIGKDAKRGLGRFYPLSRLPAGKNVYTRACNLPVQGSCADASMLALEAIDRLLFEHGIEGGPVIWMHDEIVLEVPEADAERARALLVQAMTNAFAETFPGAPLNGLVDVRIGDNWAEVKN